MKKTPSDKIFLSINNLFMCILLFIMIYPLYFVVIASFSDPRSVVLGKVFFWPKDFTLEPYINVLKYSLVWTGYRNTIIYTVIGTLYNLGILLPAAYAVSKKTLPGRNVIMFYFIATMFIAGGLIPSYLLINSIGWINKPYVMMFASGVSAYNLIVCRTFFLNSIPEEIYEAAYIDGASNLKMFFSIALPLAKPIIAVMVLFYGVSSWNSWWNAYIYISNRTLYPLQLVLRQILIENRTALAELTESDSGYSEALRKVYMAEGMKYSLIFISSAPLLVAYPFVQKYFVQGVMIGSIKG